MGNKNSTPKYPPIDPLFQDVGCVAQSVPDYNVSSLDNAPFYTEYFEIRSPNKGKGNNMMNSTTSSYDGMKNEIIARFVRLKVVAAPVYLLTAYDASREVIVCRLFFPSMIKNVIPTTDDIRATSKNESSTSNDYMLNGSRNSSYNVFSANDPNLKNVLDDENSRRTMHLKSYLRTRGYAISQETDNSVSARKGSNALFGSLPTLELAPEQDPSADFDTSAFSFPKKADNTSTTPILPVQNPDAIAVRAPNASTLGNSHLWMTNLLYGIGHYVKPYSSCMVRIPRTKEAYTEGFVGTHTFDYYSTPLPSKIRGKKPKDEQNESRSFMHGCVRDDPKNTQCRQSKKVHKGMGIYSKKKTAKEYPIAYFHAYLINPSDPRIARYIDRTSPARLMRNILPSFIELIPGCRYALISPNLTYFYVLSKKGFTLFWNSNRVDYVDLCKRRKPIKDVKPVFVRRFKGGYDTRMLIEDDLLNIYSKKSEDSEEILAYSVVISNTKEGGPFTMILNDDGTFDVFDVNNKNVTNPAFKANNDAEAMRNVRATGLNTGDEDSLNSIRGLTDLQRRILNLKAYLRIRGYTMLNDIETSFTSTERISISKILSIIMKSNANSREYNEYNTQINYQTRLEELLLYLLREKAISQQQYDLEMARINAYKKNLSSNLSNAVKSNNSLFNFNFNTPSNDYSLSDTNVDNEFDDLLGYDMDTDIAEGVDIDSTIEDDENAAQKSQDKEDKEEDNERQYEKDKSSYEFKSVNEPSESYNAYVPSNDVSVPATDNDSYAGMTDDSSYGTTMGKFDFQNMFGKMEYSLDQLAGTSSKAYKEQMRQRLLMERLRVIKLNYYLTHKYTYSNPYGNPQDYENANMNLINTRYPS